MFIAEKMRENQLPAQNTSTNEQQKSPQYLQAEGYRNKFFESKNAQEVVNLSKVILNDQRSLKSLGLRDLLLLQCSVLQALYNKQIFQVALNPDPANIRILIVTFQLFPNSTIKNGPEFECFLQILVNYSHDKRMTVDIFIRSFENMLKALDNDKMGDFDKVIDLLKRIDAQKFKEKVIIYEFVLSLRFTDQEQMKAYDDYKLVELLEHSIESNSLQMTPKENLDERLSNNVTNYCLRCIFQNKMSLDLICRIFELLIKIPHKSIKQNQEKGVKILIQNRNSDHILKSLDTIFEKVKLAQVFEITSKFHKDIVSKISQEQIHKIRIRTQGRTNLQTIIFSRVILVLSGKKLSDQKSNQISNFSLSDQDDVETMFYAALTTLNISKEFLGKELGVLGAVIKSEKTPRNLQAFACVSMFQYAQPFNQIKFETINYTFWSKLETRDEIPLLNCMFKIMQSGKNVNLSIIAARLIVQNLDNLPMTKRKLQEDVAYAHLFRNSLGYSILQQKNQQSVQQFDNQEDEIYIRKFVQIFDWKLLKNEEILRIYAAIVTNLVDLVTLILQVNLFVEDLIIKAVKMIRCQEDVQCFQAVLQKHPIANIILIREISDFLVKFIKPKSNSSYQLMDRKGNFKDNLEIKRLNLFSEVEESIKCLQDQTGDQQNMFKEIIKKSRKTTLQKLCLKHTPKLKEFEIEDFNPKSNSFKQFYINRHGDVIEDKKIADNSEEMPTNPIDKMLNEASLFLFESETMEKLQSNLKPEACKSSESANEFQTQFEKLFIAEAVMNENTKSQCRQGLYGAHILKNFFSEIQQNTLPFLKQIDEGLQNLDPNFSSDLQITCQQVHYSLLKGEICKQLDHYSTTTQYSQALLQLVKAQNLEFVDNQRLDVIQKGLQILQNIGQLSLHGLIIKLEFFTLTSKISFIRSKGTICPREQIIWASRAIFEADRSYKLATGILLQLSNQNKNSNLYQNDKNQNQNPWGYLNQLDFENIFGYFQDQFNCEQEKIPLSKASQYVLPSFDICMRYVVKSIENNVKIHIDFGIMKNDISQALVILTQIYSILRYPQKIDVIINKILPIIFGLSNSDTQSSKSKIYSADCCCLNQKMAEFQFQKIENDDELFQQFKFNSDLIWPQLNISEVLFLLKNKLFQKYLALDYSKKSDSLIEKEARRHSIRSSIAGKQTEQVKKSLLDIIIDDTDDMSWKNLGVINPLEPILKANTLYLFQRSENQVTLKLNGQQVEMDSPGLDLLFNQIGELNCKIMISNKIEKLILETKLGQYQSEGRKNSLRKLKKDQEYRQKNRLQLYEKFKEVSLQIDSHFEKVLQNFVLNFKEQGQQLRICIDPFISNFAFEKLDSIRQLGFQMRTLQLFQQKKTVQDCDFETQKRQKLGLVIVGEEPELKGTFTKLSKLASPENFIDVMRGSTQREYIIDNHELTATDRIRSCLTQEEHFMWSGHGTGEKHFMPLIKSKMDICKEEQKTQKTFSDRDKGNSFGIQKPIETVKPQVWLFGCKSVAMSDPIPGNLFPDKKSIFAPQNSVLTKLVLHGTQNLFGCTFNSISNVLDQIQINILQRILKNHKEGNLQNYQQIALEELKEIEDESVKYFMYASCCVAYDLT